MNKLDELIEGVKANIDNFKLTESQFKEIEKQLNILETLKNNGNVKSLLLMNVYLVLEIILMELVEM